MAGGSASAGALKELGTIFRFGAVGALADSQLLQRYLTGCDGADQAAFTALVERHGPMVLSVCRQVLGDPHDAQDAFQATFLILARRAGSLRNGESLSSWLHGVALRVAARARSNESLRKMHERRCALMAGNERPGDGVLFQSHAELHEEIARLPQRYREPVVLCYLEGLTSEEAAVRIGCAPGTVWSRLSRARERLRRSLIRRGVALPAALLACELTPPVSAALPATLLDATVRASLIFAGRRATEAAVASSTAITLASGVLYAMMISKLSIKILGTASLACALALGGVQSLTLGQSPGLRGGQEPAAAAPGGEDSYTAMSRSVDKLERVLDETERRNDDMRKELRRIRTELKAISTGPRPAAMQAVTQLAEVLKEQPARAVSQFADVLKRHQPRRGGVDGERMQVYMLDLIAGGTTLIADESVTGLTWSGSPTWSHDGTRIVFDAGPGRDWARSHLKSIEVVDGRPKFTDLGPGNCPTFSPGDKRIAFLLNPGAVAGAEDGVWVMEADGSQRRRAGEFGAPFWSPDGREFLINSFSDPTESTVMNLDKVTGGKVEVPGYRLFSYPSWAGPGTLVSALCTTGEGDTIALLDVTNPSETKIIEVLWQRDKDLDVTPRWPVYWPQTRHCYFVGVEPNKRTLYSLDRGKSRRAKQVEAKGQDDKLGGLAFSPDGRYLLIGADRP